MTDAPHEKLSYSRGVLEKIRASYEKLSRDELLDLISWVSKTYIVEQTIPYDLPIPEREAGEPEPRAERPPDLDMIGDDAPPAPVEGTSPAQQFARLMDGLKKRTRLPQLDHFAIEEGRVVLTVDNQRVTFGDRVTVEFVPQRGRNRPPEPASPPPAPTPPPAAEPPPPGARPGLPGGDGRTRQGGPVSRPPMERPQERRRAPEPPPPPQAPEKKSGDLADVDHIVERFKRLDLD